MFAKLNQEAADTGEQIDIDTTNLLDLNPAILAKNEVPAMLRI
jgi:hypothetical protein